ncbi:OLC1v1020221C1 [Oldenlandia corymbosa var. corymbosa]|uniref:OLC1v1020221C1 n=1 Tax=Oldenlandia corymbosa var. corymbosa TaxID=529605 RepID=A0AAV1EGC8_OLDCO|nr:OLC1v1020221C1 [Oldenlandia corymbosa var. corymbosa]
MVSSSVLDRIQSALDRVETMLIYSDRRSKVYFESRTLRLWLRNLKTFVLIFSNTELGNDNHVGLFLLRIADTVQTFARKADSWRDGIGMLNNFFFNDRYVIKFELLCKDAREWETKTCLPLKFEMEERYVTLQMKSANDVIHKIIRGSPYHQVLDILDSILEQLVDLLDLDKRCNSNLEVIIGLEDAAPALRDQMVFLISLIRFSISIPMDGPPYHCHTHDLLLAHAEPVSITAARLLLKLNCVEYVRADGIWDEISSLVSRVNPFDLHIHTQVLINGAKSSDQKVDFIAITDVLDGFTSKLWYLLTRPETYSHVIPMEDQLQELYQWLRFLSITLKQPPHNFDLKAKADII